MNESSRSFTDLSEEAQKMQVAIWALNFLLAEVDIKITALLAALKLKGTLSEEDQEMIARLCGDKEKLSEVYGLMDYAFHEKCKRIIYALQHPGETVSLDEKDPSPGEDSTNE